ncbi:LOW QUALITY PROTEIN: hypothetical protein ACHAW6_005179 [Cyclotella cf. meneghiniana]
MPLLLTLMGKFESVELQNISLKCKSSKLTLALPMHSDRRFAVDKEWLKGILHILMGFAHLTPNQMLDHLKPGRAVLDHMDVYKLTLKLTKPWDGNENPATHFTRDDQYEYQLIKAGLPDQQVLCLNITLASYKATGLYDGPL